MLAIAHNRNAQMTQQAFHGQGISKSRHIAEAEAIGRQQPGCQNRQGGIFGTANLDIPP